MKKWIIFFCAIALSAHASFAQTSAAARPSAATAAAQATVQDTSQAAAQAHLQLAMSSIEYPVTPSDSYLLTYRQSTGENVTRAIQVASDYQIDLGIFGKIDATKMTFAELKRRVESLYAESYARSYPTLSIVSVGVFRVSITGEISRSSTVTAWGLMRLSDVVDLAEAPNASLRNILVKSRGASSPTRYDILKAMRLGDVNQDPFIRPGDTVTLTPAGRIIKLTGEIRERGDYELLRSEGLRDLIEQYGGGLTANAEGSRIRIDRLSKSGPASEYMPLQKAYDSNLALDDCFAVDVPSKMGNMPVVWFEGAVVDTSRTAAADTSVQASATAAVTRGEAADAQTNAPAGSGVRIAVQISEGELLSDALSEVRASLAPMADLASASLFRQGTLTPIAVNLQPLLATSNPSSDVALKPYDRIYIPTLRSTVRVAGAVLAPGNFPYQPNSRAAFFIGLAGGSDPRLNSDGACFITDAMGANRSSDSTILPGDQIFVVSNVAGITVSGAVTEPGVFPYQIGLPPALYINQAGGIDPARGSGSYYVTTLEGKRKKDTDALKPGDRIFVRQNKLGYNITTYLPVITGIVTLATSIITLNQVLQQ
jgi:polysaccharide biosynthesis/export protein